MNQMPGQPILLYDNYCVLCNKIASFAYKWSRSRIKIVGHFSKESKELRERYFSRNDTPEQMFWLFRNDVGYGGRSGIIPLIQEVIRGFFLEDSQ